MRCYWKGTEEGQLVWEVTLQPTTVEDFVYKHSDCLSVAEQTCRCRYVVVNASEVEEKTENVLRTLYLKDHVYCGDRVEIFDTWQDRSGLYNVIGPSAFRKAIGFPEMKNEATMIPRCCPEDDHVIVRFVVRDWMRLDLTKQRLYVTGGVPGLGNWLQEKIFSLTCTGGSVWEGELPVPRHRFPFTYKYAISSEKGWILETGESRLASIRAESSPSMVVMEGGHFRHEKLWKGTGVAVPVFSLRSRRSMGIGEFSDLKLMVDLCVKMGMDLVQILPVNDTSIHGMWWDSYPYSSISVFALHPIYIRIEETMEQLPEMILTQIKEAKEKLDGPVVDYEATYDTKMQLADAVYQLNGAETLQSETFVRFFESNAEWLKPYAAFLFLKDLFQTAEHWKWGKLAKPDEEDIARIVSPNRPQFFWSIGLTYWIQFHLHRQLHSVKLYAEQRGVAVKGDLPIGVDKCSVDTWLYPNLFRMDKSTGAPPDAFDANGQNWGFPTYNWEEMEKDGYQWWKARLHHMAE